MPYETNLWIWLPNQTKSLTAKNRLHMCRVENLLGGGFPDVESCFEGGASISSLKVLSDLQNREQKCG